MWNNNYSNSNFGGQGYFGYQNSCGCNNKCEMDKKIICKCKEVEEKRPGCCFGCCNQYNY